MATTAQRKLRSHAHLLRQATARVLYASGFLSSLAAARLRDRAVVLMYHRVLPQHEIEASPSHSGIITSRRAFEAQMRWLSRHMNVVTLEEFIQRLAKREPFPAKTCLVTFDDGWRDNYLHAFPVLREVGLPATVFLAAGFIGSDRCFWQERMVDLVRRLRALSESRPSLLRQVAADPDLAGFGPCLRAGPDDERDEITRAVASLKGTDVRQIEDRLEQLSALVGPSATDCTAQPQFMEWNQVREMADNGVSFGSHGMNHRILTQPDTDLALEIGESRRAIEGELERPVPSFCYPNGDYDDSVLDHVRMGGFRVAFSVRRGYVSCLDDPFAVRRINIHEDMTSTVPMFLARMVGLW